MSFYPYDDDIEAAVGADQLMQDEDDINDALRGDYDDIMDFNDEDLDTMMDASDDLSDMEGLPDGDAEIARNIVKDCQGVDDQGLPKAAITINLEMLRQDNSRRLLAQQSMYKPVLTVNKRLEFIELVLTFPTALDANLKVLFANLEKYGQKLNELTELSTELPMLSMVIVPIAGLGCYYMVAQNPVMWALQPETVNGPATQMKILVRCEEVGFFQTDEVDLASVEAAYQREEMEREKAIEAMERRDEERRARNNTLFGYNN